MSEFEYTVVRSARKTVGIRIGQDGRITLKVPNRMSQSQIEELLEEKSRWINRNLEKVRRMESEKPVHTFKNGDRVEVWGEPWILKCIQTVGESENTAQKGGYAVRLHRENGELEVAGPGTEPGQIRSVLEQWYRNHARLCIAEQAAYWQPRTAEAARRLGAEPPRRVSHITIRNQKSRWGSCSAKGGLNFNWRLVMAPPEILDYVVVHELCHLVYMNHSPQFWELVRQVMPDFEGRRAWLKENGRKLEWEATK